MLAKAEVFIDFQWVMWLPARTLPDRREPGAPMRLGRGKIATTPGKNVSVTAPIPELGSLSAGQEVSRR